jgi:PAS domain S-box-containing protein
MGELVSDLSDKYAELLTKYLEGEGESALVAAYEVSREAAASGMGLFEFQAAMRTAIESLFGTKLKPEEAWRPGPVQAFMTECLRAFDLAYGGLREAGKHAVSRADQARAETSRAQEALEATQLNYKRLFYGHPEPMWVYDLETLAFLDVNDAAVQRYGFTRDEFMAMTIKDIRPASEVPELMRSISRDDVLERSSGWVHRTKDGKLIDIEITSHRVDFGGRPARFVMAQDVTERIRLEQQVRQSQRLESLGQLAGGVAHDFNNLLGVILNFALFVKESLSAAADGPDGERWRPALKDVERIERAAESAARLTHQLLAFARREVVQARSLNVNSTITELEPLLRRALGEHIEFVIKPGDRLWPVLMDPGHLEQVLTNLAVNARDAMRNGGTLTIDTENVEVDEAYAGGRPGLMPGRFVRLRVSDTGTGMSKETLQRAFEPFFTTKPKGEGTRLGLATVHGIVNQAGGYVSIYSELGLGTRVSALLPATDQVPVAARALPGRQRQAATETVLVVEDAEDLREVVGRILSRNGFHVLIAAGGHEAIQAATGHSGRIDLLLTDVVMPQMQGTELAERIRVLQPNIKVLFMSGYAQPMLGIAGTLAPGVVLLEKPFTEPLLLASVRQVLEGKP